MTILTLFPRCGRAPCLLALAILAGCAGPQKQYELMNEPYLKANGGPLLVVDVCVLQDAVGDDDDYFLVPESKAGAQRVVDVAGEYLREKGFDAKATLIPYACGVIGDQGNVPQLVRNDVSLPATSELRPFLPHESLAGKKELLDALNVLATTTHDRALRENFAVLAQGRGGGMPPLRTHTPEEIRAAAALVRTELKADSLIYVAIQGYSQSSGKAFALGAGRLLVGVITGVATGFAVIPGGSTDGSIKAAATFDLSSGELKRTSAVRGLGDPRKPDVVSDKRLVGALFHKLLHREVEAAK